MKLAAFAWPGNVRQLRNVIESMVVVDCDETLDVDDLPVEIEPAGAPVEEAGAAGLPGLAGLVGRPLEEIERLFIAETLKVTGGNREQAAEMLGIGERTLYRKIKEFQLS
jgi:two-component system response regulator HydG